MDATCVELKECPYCHEPIEVQLKLPRTRIKLAKEEDSICGKDFVSYRQLQKKLSKKRLVKKFMNIKEMIIMMAGSRGITITKIKSIIKKEGISGEDLELMVKLLKMGPGLYMVKRGVFKVL